MSVAIWDNLTGRTAARLREEQSARIAGLESALARQAKTIGHLSSRLQESTTTDHAAKLQRSGTWTELGTNASADAIKQARQAYLEEWADKAGILRRFPYSKRAINMTAEFCFGGGLEAPVTGDDTLKDALAKWWAWPANQQAMFSMPAQHELSAYLLVDGCLMLACFEGTPGQPMLVRPMDRLEFSEVITHPDDSRKVLYYKREWTPVEYNDRAERVVNPTPRVLLYTDIDNREDDTDYDDPYREPLDAIIAKDKRGAPVRILRVKINSLGPNDWGHGIMLPLMDWELMAEEVAQDAATMSKASAALAIRLIVEGDESDVAAAEAYWGQEDTNPTVGASNAGDINVMNQAADLSVSRASTGADESYRNMRIFRQSMAVASGWALHYLGDPENANLATTSSMELPILKHALWYQGLWTYIYTRLAREALRASPKADDAQILVTMPDLVIADLLDRIEAIKAGEDAGWATEEQATTEYWTAMGAADVAAETEKALAEAEKERAEMEKQMAERVPWPPPEEAGGEGAEGEEGQANAPPNVRGGNPFAQSSSQRGGQNRPA